jgi:hypothetical protein
VKRQRWKKYQHRIAPQRLVFIDETWVKTNMAPLRGWGPPGRRLVAMSLMVIERPSPSLRLCASIVLMHLGSSMDLSTASSRCVCRENTRADAYRRDVVILDNLGSHKGQAARSAVRQAIHMMFLPPMALISIPSNSCSQNSAITCERHNRGLSIMAKGGENPRPLLTN